MEALKQLGVQWNKPDNPFWKKVGNYALFIFGPVGTAVIQVFIPEPWKNIASVAWNTIILLFKGSTKLTTDPNIK